MGLARVELDFLAPLISASDRGSDS